MTKRNDSLSGYTGVTLNRIGGWNVIITVAGKDIWLGTYDDIEKAIKARREAELKYYGADRVSDPPDPLELAVARVMRALARPRKSRSRLYAHLGCHARFGRRQPIKGGPP